MKLRGAAGFERATFWFVHPGLTDEQIRAQVEAFSPHVHAVVVGSALVRVVAEGGDIGGGVKQKVAALRGEQRRDHIFTMS